jgi:uncharacterized protein
MLAQLLERMVKDLVDDPAQVKIEETEDNRTISYRIYVAPDQLGQVIGKQGRIANAIRTIAKAVAQKKKISIDFIGGPPE